ncbi:MAG: EAL domain-containing protein [Gammaproteobacteria bacterium]|nr:EAL domain-containing protein [Gammaproteobacteria bacterium]MDH5594365.1 EAL domain-containing protein [Gammaproteobacteria bacterium]
MPDDNKNTILVIDDDSIIRKAVNKLLSKEGYVVVEAESGQRGIELFSQNIPDLVLLDVMMPDMNGYVTCKEIRKIDGAEFVPMIMLTGLDDVDAVSSSFDAGATDFISKPINWVLLAQRIRYALRSRDIHNELQRNQMRLENAQKLAKLGYWEIDPKAMVMKCSSEMCRLIKCEQPHLELPISDFLSMVDENERDNITSLMTGITENKSYVVDHYLTCKDGSRIIVQNQAEIETSSSGEILSIVGTIQDISDRKEAELLIEYHRTYDSLTELPNKMNFSGLVENAVQNAIEQHKMLAVYFVGLDRFKLINDTLGHTTGDKLLMSIGERLSLLTKRGYTIARFSGDVFSILSPTINDVSRVNSTAQDLLDIVSEKLVIDGHELFVTASIGIALFPNEDESSEALLKEADSAMFNAKSSGGNRYLYYDAGLNLKVARKVELEKDLRKAIENKEFVLYYQPQIDTESRRIIGMEALIRWQHPKKGLISPFDFIPVAEESGLIVPIGQWVLEEACMQIAKWVKQYGPLSMGINLSARQFVDGDLSRNLDILLKKENLDPQYLDLEITESIVLWDLDETVDMLLQFREKGVSTSMDDFGTGYSSLSYLHKLPIDSLKIDRAFIKDISPEDINSGAIARAIIAMAHSLGMNVIAEGVETEFQFNFLKKHGCDEIQGFLFSPPVPAEDFEQLLIQTPEPHIKSTVA